MSDEIPIDHLRRWIGNQDQETDTITPELLKRFRATLSNYIELGTITDSQIPLAMHWCLAQPAAKVHELGADGHPTKGSFLPPVPLPRRMWASSKIKFHRPPCISIPIKRVSTIADIVLKQSEASGPLVFVHVDHAYTQKTEQGSETLIEERQTIVYRQLSSFRPAQPQEIDKQSLSLEVVPDSTALFRYSALTFNGHRIHYDQGYTVSEEGYPGLVVQGPLMATILMNLAQTSRPNTPLQEFEFRGTAPAFVDQALQFRGVNDISDNNNRLSLEIRNHQGALVMNASAQFAGDKHDG